MPVRPSLAPLLLLAPLVSGCAGMTESLSEKIPLFGPSLRYATPDNPAVEVVGLWQPTEGRDAKGMPARGVSGQILFFTARGGEPVAVRGDVKIYLFADVGTAEERKTPIHEFNFSADAWGTHLERGALGPAYSVFIPYTRPETHQVKVSVRVRFTATDSPAGGGPVFSEAATAILPGPPPPEAAPVEDAAFGGGLADGLPPEMRRRLERAMANMARGDRHDRGERPSPDRGVVTAGHLTPSPASVRRSDVDVDAFDDLPASWLRDRGAADGTRGSAEGRPQTAGRRVVENRTRPRIGVVGDDTGEPRRRFVLRNRPDAASSVDVVNRGPMRFSDPVPPGDSGEADDAPPANHPLLGD